MTDETPKVRDTRADHSEDGVPTEFHLAVTQLVLQYVGVAKNKQHLAVLAKAQVVAARTVRRVITRAELSNRQPIEFDPTEVLSMVIEEDKADEAEGAGR
jgi:hypothetical protein